MALDKLVDSTQLDSDLTSVANAIRTKGGTSASLAFPADFVSAIAAIPSGGGGGGPHEVPAGYTQLQYLESSGTQIINTGVAPTLETKLQVTGVRLPTQTGYNPIAASGNPTVYIPMNNGVYSARFYAQFGNSGEKTIDWPFPIGTGDPPTVTVDKNGATFEADGATKTLSWSSTAIGTTDPDTRIALFGRKNGATFNSYTNAKIYRAKIWDNGTLVRDFVPAKRDSDSVLGMYDIVNDVFYMNDGTGVFVGGEY